MDKTTTIGVVGAGAMGRGITVLLRLYELSVVLVDRDPNILGTAGERITTELAAVGSSLDIDTSVLAGTLTLTHDVVDLANTQVVIEAVNENIEAKRFVLASIESAVPPPTVLISTTSGIMIDTLAEALGRPDQLGGIVFPNPAWHGTTVEIIRGRRTSDTTAAAMVDLLEMLRLDGIHTADAPGFVSTTVMMSTIAAAIRLVDRGVADAITVDQIMCQGFGQPQGPLATADHIGLPTVLDILNALLRQTGDPQYAPPSLLRAKVAAGQDGVRSGRGFHDYPALAATRPTVVPAWAHPTKAAVPGPVITADSPVTTAGTAADAATTATDGGRQ